MGLIKRPGKASNVTALGKEVDLKGNWNSFLVTPRANSSAFYSINNPQAVYDKGSNRTYIVYQGESIDPYITYYDHTNKKLVNSVRVGISPIANNDNHGVPSMVIDNTGYIHIFFGSHNIPFQYAKSNKPHDISSWTQRAMTDVIPGTYPLPAYDPIANVIYLLFRAGIDHGSTYPCHEFAAFYKSSDNGATWIDIGPIIDTTKHPDIAKDAYVMDCDYNNGKIHITWMLAHGASHDDTRGFLYHMYYNPLDGKLYSAGNTLIGSVITWDLHPMAEIYPKDNINVAKHAFGKNGEIYIVFNDYNETLNKIIVQIAKWNGTTWTINDTGARHSNLNHYQQIRVKEDGKLEGFFINGRDKDEVNLSTTDFYKMGADLTYWTSDDGVIWSYKDMICSGDDIRGMGIAKSAMPLNSHPSLKILYTGYSLNNDQGYLPMYAGTNEMFDYVTAIQKLGKSPESYIIRLDPGGKTELAKGGSAVTTSYASKKLINSAGIDILVGNATAAFLRVCFKGNGTKGINRFYFREGGTTRAQDADCTFYGDYTTDFQVQNVWVPLSEDNAFEWKYSGTTMGDLLLQVLAFQTN